MARPMAEMQLFDADLGEAPFTVRTSLRARRLMVRVYPGGRVEVTVPTGTRPADVERFVTRHRSWIDTRVAELAAHPLAADLPLPTSVHFQALEETWTVEYRAGERNHCRIVAPGRLEVHGRPADPAGARRSLRSWLAAEARRSLEPWITELAAEGGFAFERIQLRRQRTRWGSCSRTGTISLNVSLLFQPPCVVRYLLLHELCHTRHMNHSDRYWRLVESHEPDYRNLDRALTRGWQHVPHWVYAQERR